MSGDDTLRLYQTLSPGDRVEVTHAVKVGFRDWTTATCGTVVEKSREKRGLHFRRAADEPVYSDILILRRDDGELTTVTLDEFTTLKLLERPAEAPAHGG